MKLILCYVVNLVCAFFQSLVPLLTIVVSLFAIVLLCLCNCFQNLDLIHLQTLVQSLIWADLSTYITRTWFFVRPVCDANISLAGTGLYSLYQQDSTVYGLISLSGILSIGTDMANTIGKPAAARENLNTVLETVSEPLAATQPIPRHEPGWSIVSAYQFWTKTLFQI